MRTLIDFDDAPVFAIPAAGGVREGVLVEGPQGWGEFSPPADSDDALAARWLTAAMEPSTVGWPDAIRGRVPVAVAIPEVDPAIARRLVTAGRSGCARVAVGARHDSGGADADRVSAVRDAQGLGGSVRCVVEATEADEAIAAITRLDRAAGGLEMVELKCRSVEIAAAVRRGVDVPIAVDAVLLSATGSTSDAADIAVLRCGPLGGVRRALRRAEALGLPCVVNLAGLTSIGMAGDVALAAVLPDLPFACGPAAVSPADGDVVAEARSLVPADGYLPAAPTPAAPDPVRVARYTVTDPATVGRWRELLRRAAAAS